MILANYSRYEENEPDYTFQFPHNLQVWEAASATSAAPSYFKPFRSWSNHRTYLDGAIYYNNPVKIANHERKFLWPDVAENPPDILLSIGTGKNGQQMEHDLQVALTDRVVIRETQPGTAKKTQTWKDYPSQAGISRRSKKDRSSLLSKFFSVLVCLVHSIATANRAIFRKEIVGLLITGLGQSNRQHLEFRA